MCKQRHVLARKNGDLVKIVAVLFGHCGLSWTLLRGIIGVHFTTSTKKPKKDLTLQGQFGLMLPRGWENSHE
jgi:hypothetical protein